MVAARFLPDLGGTETHIYEVARRLTAQGDLEITVLATDRSGICPVREDFEGITVLRCRAFPRNRDYYFAPAIYSHVLNGDYDVVHCQGIHTAVPVIAMMAARRRRIPYILTLHTGGHSSGFRRRLRNTQWRALSPLLRKAAAIVAVSPFERELFREACSLPLSQFRIVRNGGDLPVDPSQVKVIPGRIVSCGRLEKYKGHQRLIEALPIVQRSVGSATLHILGSGTYENQLRSLISSLSLEKSVTIEYIRPDNRELIGESLGRAAVVAVLSEYEANPLAVMEALALGIPTIGLDTAGIGDLVEEGLVRGVPADASPNTIAKILVAALTSERSSVSARLPTWEHAAADLAQVYRQVAGES